MSTGVHEGIVGVFNEHVAAWRARLRESSSNRISDAALTLRLHMHRDIDLEASEGLRDKKSLDGGIKHHCNLRCPPALVFEVRWASSREELKYRARDYTAIRTVVVVYMNAMLKAEQKKERRPKERYRAAQVDENGEYSYLRDEINETGGASILVWRAEIRNNRLTVGRVHEMKIRDANGNPVESASLSLSLEGCVCHDIINSVKGSRARQLEIPSKAFCEAIAEDLENYREKRDRVIRTVAELENERKVVAEEERQREEERLQRAAEVRRREAEGEDGRVWGHVEYLVG
ncbi:hypothetical protein GGR58DRAFT_510244 [Xylaria digitata]|nr:hypothetical protein GGR58DRAFT_510244 [Xylaria digitata]